MKTQLSVMRLLRQRKGITQAVLAKAVGFSQAVISTAESGGKTPAGCLRRIAEILGWDGEPEELQSLCEFVNGQVQVLPKEVSIHE